MANEIAGSLYLVTLDGGSAAFTSVSLPLLETDASGAFHSGHIDVDLPLFSITSNTGYGTSNELPAKELSSQGSVESIGVSGEESSQLPDLELSATGTEPFVGSASLSLPDLRLTANGTIPISAVLDDDLPLIRVSATGTPESRITGDTELVLPPLRLTGEGVIPITSTLAEPLPILSLGASGTVASATSGDTENTLPKLHLTASGTLAITRIAENSLPVLALSASGTTAFDVSGGEAITLPKITVTSTGTLSAVNAASNELPVFTVSSNGLTGEISSHANLSLPSKSLSSVATSPASSVANVILPCITGGGYTGSTASLEMPAKELSSSGSTGQPNTFAGVLPLFSFSASGVHSANGSLQEALPTLTANAGASQSLLVSASISLPRFTLDIVASVGTKGDGANILPIPAILSTGGEEVEGVLEESLPLPGLLAEILSAVYSTVVMNTANTAVTEYSDFNFNSFAKFNGEYLAAGVNGIARLAGENDLTGQIASSFRTGSQSYGALQIMRIHDVYLYGRITGKMDVILTTEEHESYQYRTYGNLDTRLRTDRIKTAKGAKSAAWDIELKNVVGADFDIEQVDMHSIITTRKVG